MPQNALTGWMMLLGWIPLALLAPFFDAQPLRSPSAAGWFALVYNMFLAGTLAHAAWYTLARTLPVAVSSMSSLPVPIVGVFSGMLLLGERPGPGEWAALALVIAAMIAVLWVPKAGRRRTATGQLNRFRRRRRFRTMNKRPGCVFVVPWIMTGLSGVDQVVLNLYREFEAGGEFAPQILVTSWAHPRSVTSIENGKSIAYMRVRDARRLGRGFHLDRQMGVPADPGALAHRALHSRE